MDTNFAIIIFALTIIVIVAIVKENNNIAQNATAGLVKIASDFINLLKR
jgi:hypothetical protein